MEDIFKAWGDAQQSMWKAWFPLSRPADWHDQGGAADQPLVEQFSELHEIWKTSIEKWAALSGEGNSPGAVTPEALRDLFTPARWGGKGVEALDAGLRHVIEGPKYAVLWDMDRRLTELNQLTVQRARDIEAYRAIVQGAWNRALAKFGKTTAEVDGAKTWRAMAERWLAVVNDTLIETYRTEEFLEAQRRLLRTSSECRLKEQAIAEAFCEANHIPTRSEVDELQRTVVQLRREVRSLQRAGTKAVSGTHKPSPTASKVKERA